MVGAVTYTDVGAKLHSHCGCDVECLDLGRIVVFI